MIEIINRIEECDDGRHRMRPDDRVLGLVMHEFGLSLAHDAAGIARFYRINAQYTGGQMPYTAIVQPSGLIEQSLRLLEVGPHALRWSKSTIGIAALGSFNKHPPPVAQWMACAEFFAELCLAHSLEPLGQDDNGEYIVSGHTEHSNATNSVGKICPGRYWDMNEFRAEVARCQKESAIQRLAAQQVVA